jgi:multidrug efflux pump subunit AcrB
VAWRSPWGILVDDATVEIENIHRNLHLGKPLIPAILEGAQQIATPAFVATLCICIVFVPVVFHHRGGTLVVHADGDGRGVCDVDQLLA